MKRTAFPPFPQEKHLHNPLEGDNAQFAKKKDEEEGKEYEVTFKIGYVNGEIISKRPEYEDLKRIAIDSGLSLRKVKEIIHE